MTSTPAVAEIPALATSAVGELVLMLESAGCEVLLGSESYPDVIAISPSAGIIVIDLAEVTADAERVLNREVATLREAVPSIARTPLHRQVVDPRDAAGEAWLASLRKRPLPRELADDLRGLFEAPVSIDVPRRTTPTDGGAAERATMRTFLDREQTSAAHHVGAEAIVITGPPGSGKTLVLAARARWLATQHPDWQIQMLCWNNMLARHLTALVADIRQVSVTTFNRFLSDHRIRVSSTDQDRASRDIEDARRSISPTFDAILVDEWQDMPLAANLLPDLIRPGRGGLAVAGDPKQSILPKSLPGPVLNTDTLTVTLHRPYRSTRPILEVTSAMDQRLEVSGRESAVPGPPVDLVWADTQTSQAAAVARDVVLLLQSGERQPQDIAVLVPFNRQIGRTKCALTGAGIPVRDLYKKNHADLDLAEPTVKVMTVASAKGLEFDVIFLVGIDQLPDPDGDPKNDIWGHTNYVGATRARDQLVLTYSKHNVYLDRIRSLPEDTLRSWVWPDDYPEV